VGAAVTYEVVWSPSQRRSLTDRTLDHPTRPAPPIYGNDRLTTPVNQNGENVYALALAASGAAPARPKMRRPPVQPGPGRMCDCGCGRELPPPSKATAGPRARGRFIDWPEARGIWWRRWATHACMARAWRRANPEHVSNRNAKRRAERAVSRRTDGERAADRGRYRARLADGLCGQCGRKARRGLSTCRRCFAYQSAKQRRYMDRLQAARPVRECRCGCGERIGGAENGHKVFATLPCRWLWQRRHSTSAS
jgi:hypothetical protein